MLIYRSGVIGYLNVIVVSKFRPVVLRIKLTVSGEVGINSCTSNQYYSGNAYNACNILWLHSEVWWSLSLK